MPEADFVKIMLSGRQYLIALQIHIIAGYAI